jgi:hypothetical protein
MILKLIAIWMMAQREVLRAAKELKVFPLPVILCYSKKRYTAKYAYIAVLVNIKYAKVSTRTSVKISARHEMRHAWQKKNHSDVYFWWASKKRIDAYKAYYWTPLCSIEEDARSWSKTGVGREDLLTRYSALSLALAYHGGYLSTLLDDIRNNSL